MVSDHHLLSLRADLLDNTLPGIELPPGLCTAVVGFSMVYSSLFKPHFSSLIRQIPCVTPVGSRACRISTEAPG